MRVLVVGASSGTGRRTVEALLRQGHEVTAFARSAAAMPDAPRLTRAQGDALVPADIDAAVIGHDAVVVTLGIHESPVLVRLGFRRTPIDVRSRGTANTIAAMQRHGVRRIVVQTSYGVGQSRGRLPLGWSMLFAVLLAPQIADTERQEELVRASGLAWTLVQPVGLTDAEIDRPVFTSTTAETRSMQVSRAQVAAVIADEIGRATGVHATLAVSS